MVKSGLGGGGFRTKRGNGSYVTVEGLFHGPFGGLNPGTVGSEDCEGLFPHLETKGMIAEKYLARHFLSIQQALEESEWDNAFRAPGADNTAERFGASFAAFGVWPLQSRDAATIGRCGLGRKEAMASMRSDDLRARRYVPGGWLETLFL